MDGKNKRISEAMVLRYEIFKKYREFEVEEIERMMKEEPTVIPGPVFDVSE